MSAKPLLRWVGGKTQLLSYLLELVPKQFNRYYEPFVGGGAFYYALNPGNAVLNDFNPRLINVYTQVRDNVQSVISHLYTFEYSAQCYYEQRNALNAEKLDQLDTLSAARFIFLNKTCFNGLWRENASGQFNVPYGGDRKRAKHVDISNLLECSNRLRGSAYSQMQTGTILRCKDFADSLFDVLPGDFVYFDPPYIPLKTTSFVDYKADGFDYKEQVRLRDLAYKLKDNGVHVMLSNSDTTLTRQLYADFELYEVKARRSVNSNGAGRGRIGELIIK
jgi:DNA adenine methylase